MRGGEGKGGEGRGGEGKGGKGKGEGKERAMSPHYLEAVYAYGAPLPPNPGYATDRFRDIGN